MINTDPKKIEDLLTRGVAEVIDKEHLRELLSSGDTLRIKLGIDPTSPNLHLGRSIPLLKLRDFQELGHQVFFIVGDFTGQIGDTSDKDAERPMLSEDLVKKNMATYLEQAYKILDPETSVVFNSKWLSKLTLDRMGHMASWFSLSEFINRENIKKRLEEGKRVSLRELFYPLMQGYDSVMVDSDVEIGGTDQRFNLLAGRELQRHQRDILSNEHRQMIKEIIGNEPRNRSSIDFNTNKPENEPQDILMTNLIMGTDGRKMSSSWGNTINITDEPNDMFGKVMSIPDELIIEYLIHCTRVPMEAIQENATKLQNGANPRDAKIFLAKSLVALYHSEAASDEAEDYFINTFSKGEIPEDVKEVQVTTGELFVDLLVRESLAASKSDARRKIEQGALSIDGEKITDVNAVITSQHTNKVIKVGKKDFVRIN